MSDGTDGGTRIGAGGATGCIGTSALPVSSRATDQHKHCFQQRAPGIESRRFAKNELLGTGGDTIAWRARETCLPNHFANSAMHLSEQPALLWRTRWGPPVSRETPPVLGLALLPRPTNRGRVWMTRSRLRPNQREIESHCTRQLCSQWNEPSSSGQIVHQSGRCSHFSNTTRARGITGTPNQIASVLPTSRDCTQHTTRCLTQHSFMCCVLPRLQTGCKN